MTERDFAFVEDADLRRELESGQTAPDDPAIHLHLNQGAPQEVRPASSVTLDDDEVLLMYGDAVIARYPRSDVSFASTKDVPPFPS